MMNEALEIWGLHCNRINHTKPFQNKDSAKQLASRSNASGAPKIPETLPAYVRRIQPVAACSHSCTYVFLMPRVYQETGVYILCPINIFTAVAINPSDIHQHIRWLRFPNVHTHRSFFTDLRWYCHNQNTNKKNSNIWLPDLTPWFLMHHYNAFRRHPVLK